MDILLRGQDSSEPVKLVGKYPLLNSLPMDLRIESHGDGLKFLEGLSDEYVSWKAGTADLRF